MQCSMCGTQTAHYEYLDNGDVVCMDCYTKLANQYIGKEVTSMSSFKPDLPLWAYFYGVGGMLTGLIMPLAALFWLDDTPLTGPIRFLDALRLPVFIVCGVALIVSGFMVTTRNNRAFIVSMAALGAFILFVVGGGGVYALLHNGETGTIGLSPAMLVMLALALVVAVLVMIGLSGRRVRAAFDWGTKK
jgi:hypothetical protein